MDHIKIITVVMKIMFLQFSIHFTFINLRLYKGKIVEVTLVELLFIKTQEM